MKVRLVTTLGEIMLELEPQKAPGTVENFLGYVRDGHYDGTLFHRVISGFMIQGGGFAPGMNERPTAGDNIRNEADNGLKNVTGAVAMARRPDPHSASAQFFINVSDNAFLDFKAKTDDGWGYCVFGRVVEGMDVVSRIEESATATRAMHGDVPVEDVLVERAEALEE
jgi:peptidyl-prolyl cis-trans isomerase B (cyclophilin B)